MSRMLLILGTGPSVGKTIFTLGVLRSAALHGRQLTGYKPVLVSCKLVARGNELHAQEAISMAEAGRYGEVGSFVGFTLCPVDKRVQFDLFGYNYEVDVYRHGQFLQRTFISDIDLDVVATGIGEDLTALAAGSSDVVVEGSGHPLAGHLATLANLLHCPELWTGLILTDAASGIGDRLAADLLAGLDEQAAAKVFGFVMSRQIGVPLDPGREARLAARFGRSVLGRISYMGGDASPDLRAHIATAMEKRSVLGDGPWYDAVSRLVAEGLDTPQNLSVMDHLLLQTDA